MDLVKDPESWRQPPQVGVGIAEPSQVGRPFEVEIDSSFGPRIGDSSGERRLTDLSRSEQDDRCRRPEPIAHDFCQPTRNHRANLTSAVEFARTRLASSYPPYAETMLTSRRRTPSVLVTGVLLLAACSPGGHDGGTPDDDGAAADTDSVTTSDVATDLEAPWSVVVVQGAPLVSERDSGRILEVLDDGTTRTVGTVTDVEPRGEAGLLGLAIDDGDDGDDASRLYTYSTGPDGNRVQRWTLDGGPGTWTLGTSETLLSGLPAASYHDGGRIAFGPDGMLYVPVGDAGDPQAAQDPGSPAGTILRVTPDGEIPPGNPFPGSPVWSYGHRNVQGLAWDDDGTLYASEFGENTWDELNVIEPGANYGWPLAEGAVDDPDLTDPVQQWPTEEASPSGIAIVADTLYVANLRGASLRAVPLADPTTSTVHLDGTLGRLRDVLPAPGGDDLWVLTNNTDGRGSPRDGDDRIVTVGTPVTGTPEDEASSDDVP